MTRSGSVYRLERKGKPAGASFDGGPSQLAKIARRSQSGRGATMARQERSGMIDWRKLTLLNAVVGFAGVVAIAAAFEDNIGRFALKPQTPFQIADPPPPPDYANGSSWLLLPGRDGAGSDAEGAIDVFYIHSGTFISRRAWNAPFDDPASAERAVTIAAPNEIGPFLHLGQTYAPFYRQAATAAQFTHKYDGMAARSLAYGDVVRAFERFLTLRRANRGVLLVGYGQGAVYASGLIEQFFTEDHTMSASLVAAYLIGAPIPRGERADPGFAPPPCGAPDASGCIVAFAAFEPDFADAVRETRKRAVAWRRADPFEPRSVDRPDLICHNPLSWGLDDGYIGAAAHRGAASATGIALGADPPVAERAVGAACENGVLIVDPPRADYLRRPRWFTAEWKTPTYNLFWRDLRDNASVRVEAFLQRRREATAKDRLLPPIDAAVDLERAPIHKVPKLNEEPRKP